MTSESNKQNARSKPKVSGSLPPRFEWTRLRRNKVIELWLTGTFTSYDFLMAVWDWKDVTLGEAEA